MRTKEELRNKFFMDCTDMNDGTPKVDMSPHNVFEWINSNIIEQKLIAQEREQSDSEITIFEDSTYTIQFRDNLTSRGTSDFRIKGSELLKLMLKTK